MSKYICSSKGNKAFVKLRNNMKCFNCEHELNDENILANLVKISPVEQIDLNVICPECGLIHYRFIDVSDLTWTRGAG